MLFGGRRRGHAVNGSPAKLVEAIRCDCLSEAMCCDEKIGYGGMVA